MICFIYHYTNIHWFIHHGNTWTHKWPTTNISRFIKLSWLERRTCIMRSWVQTPLKSWIFQTSLKEASKIAFITARIIIATLDFISAIQYMYMVHFIHVYYFIHIIKTVADLTSNFLVLKKCNGKLVCLLKLPSLNTQLDTIHTKLFV